MALSPSRVVLVGETPHAFEQEAIEFVRQNLDDVDPYRMWALVDLQDPHHGNLYEIDLLVLGFSALYLIEIKSGPGTYQGDGSDWVRVEAAGAQHRMDCPTRLANFKAKVRKSRIGQTLKSSVQPPWVQPLVFLSSPDAHLKLSTDGCYAVVTRKDLRLALTHHRFPGAQPDWPAKRIDSRQAQAIAQALSEIGIRQRKGKLMADEYELGQLLDEGSGFQDREAVHSANPRQKCRARTWLVPQATSVERRQHLRRAADREAQLLFELRDHPRILRYAHYAAGAPLGPTVIFEPFDGGQRLDAFLRQHPELSFTQRVDLIYQVADALSFCHRRNIVHGCLSPQAVLARLSDKGAIETRLSNFQFGLSQSIEGTQNLSSLHTDPVILYQAPELFEGPHKRNRLSDVYSLGMLSHLVLVGRPPAATLRDIESLMQERGNLAPVAVSDTLSSEVVKLIGDATMLIPSDRPVDAANWAEQLLEIATASKPEPETATVDPLSATKDCELDGGNFKVLQVLGHGATARVLQVQRASDGRRYALKVSLAPEHDTRLQREAAVLRGLKHPRIVQLIDEHMLGGRCCLLLSLAGETTLQHQLVKEGTLSLDYVTRYGDELLSALELLEEKGVTHRDIKPANIGVGAVGKEARHLTLIDFSLSKEPLEAIDVGTAAYRDPFLRDRRRWDASADRYSAGLILHEMLTGQIPSYGGLHGSALDQTAQLMLAVERFYPAIRDQLKDFFTRALARDQERRFTSAAEMRRHWLATCAAGQDKGQAERPGEKAPELSWTPDQLGAINDDTATSILPISLRAINSLERAGLATALDLLGLPENRLSAIRGVGTQVAKEILAFRAAWAQHRRQPGSAVKPGPAIKPYFASYVGDDLDLTQTNLERHILEPLFAAGIESLAVLAQTPAAQVERIAANAGFKIGVLREVLKHEHQKASEREHPSSLAGWIEALLGSRSKTYQYLRAAYGLAEPFTGKVGIPTREAAKELGISPARLYQIIGTARDQWRSHPAYAVLAGIGTTIVERHGGAVPLEQAAGELLLQVKHDRKADKAILIAQGASLLRIVAEVEKEQPDGITYLRLHEQDSWLLSNRLPADVLRALGQAADQLARRETIASSSEALRTLQESVAGTSLAVLSPRSLLTRAAAASQHAACSAPLEIYPRDMDPQRALELSASILTGDLSAEEIRSRVRSRYPQAEELPERPELDALVGRLHLTFDAETSTYHRAGQVQSTSLYTFASSGVRYETALPEQQLAMDPPAVAARAFADGLRDAYERRSLVVLLVLADKAQKTVQQLHHELAELEELSFDRLFHDALFEVARQNKIQDPEKIIFSADAAGPAGPKWPKLLALARLAADQVTRTLLPVRKPTLLTELGLTKRYGLESFLRSVVASARRDDSQATFILLPGHDIGGPPTINEGLVVPDVRDTEIMRVNRDWLNNRHRTGARAQ